MARMGNARRARSRLLVFRSQRSAARSLFGALLVAAIVGGPGISSSAAGNQPPVASFTASCVQLTCSFNGTASTDADGSIAGYAWTFGDGATASTPTASHTYATAGSYPVVLTVTDDANATGASTQSAAVAPPAYNPSVAADDFGRTVASGWGTADLGGSYTIRPPATLSVSGGRAHVTVAAGVGKGGYLTGLSVPDTNSVATITTNVTPTGTGQMLYLIGRLVNSTNDYRVRVRLASDLKVRIALAKLDNSSSETVIGSEVPVAGLTYAANTDLRVRLVVDGVSPTTLRARVWLASQTEPATWQVTATDSTPALQVAGGVGLHEFASSSVTNGPVIASFDDYRVNRVDQAPVPQIAPSCTSLSCTFDSSGSTDPDGTIASRTWVFGDGTSAAGTAPTHVFPAAGTYPVTLTVTDNRGVAAWTTTNVSVTASSAPLTAAFTPSCSALTCTFDASASSGGDHTIASYAWDFGDGTSGSGVTASHPFAAAGVYSVKLTVTDDIGGTDSAVATVSPQASANVTVLASDTFTRTVASGWGSTAPGGAWTNSGNNSVNGSTGLLVAAASSGGSDYLGSVSSTDSSVVANVSTDKVATGNGQQLSLIGRRVNATEQYRGRLRIAADGGLWLGAVKLDGGSSDVLIGAETKVTGLTNTAGAQWRMRADVTGTAPTRIRVRLWPAAQTEPTTWNLNLTDASPAIQAAGSVGVSTYIGPATTNAPITFRVDNFSAATTAPAAQFTHSCTVLVCSFDATSSTASAGSIAGYAWSFGDGVTSTAGTPTHTYSAAGSYVVTLTVTDSRGANGMLQSAVVVGIGHIFVINLENEDFDQAWGPTSPATYLNNTLRPQGKLLPQYYGIGHGSLANYIAQISGQSPNSKTQGDCDPYVNFTSTGTGAYGQALGSGCVYPASVPTIASQLTAAGRTWKAYQEDMGNSATEPKTCRHPAIGGHDATESARLGDEYANKHDPFVYFHSIIDLPICTTNVVDLPALDSDLTSEATTPNLSYITPNLCNDAHDEPCIDGRPGGLVSADVWLTTWVPKIMASPAYADDGLIVITFDEAEPTGSGTDASACCNTPPSPNTSTPGVVGPGGGRVGALLLSPHVAPNTTDETPYNHYALLCSMEDAFGLPRLGFAGAPGLGCFGPDVYDH